MRFGKVVILVALCSGFYYLANDRGWLDGTILSLHPSAEIGLEELSSDFGEKDLFMKYSNLDWKCQTEKTNMGDRSCWAPIRSWNEICAKYAAFFFSRQDRLRMVKIAVAPRCFNELEPSLTKRYGTFRALPPRKGVNQNLLGWRAGKGLVVISDRQGNAAENTVLWMTSKSLLGNWISQKIPG